MHGQGTRDRRRTDEIKEPPPARSNGCNRRPTAIAVESKHHILLTETAHLRSFLQQLRRRNVFRSMAAYLIAAWLIVQVLDVVGPALSMPAWVMTFVVISLAVGLPVVAVVSWFFEFTTGGLRREREEADSVASGSTPVFSYVIIAMLAAALGVSLILREGGSGIISTADAASIRLAVLPLDAIGGSIGDAGFVDGLHDDMLTMLARISSLEVISRTSVLPFADSGRSIPDIGKRLGVGSILEGSVQISGERIRVSVQLIDVATDKGIWSEVFERPFDVRAIFSIQRDIAQAISRNLSIALTGEDQERIEREPTSNFDAYNAYLLGRDRMSRRTSDNLREAEAFFRRAIGFDSTYADAWAGLAEVLILQHDYAGLDRDEMYPPAMRAVQRALELEPEFARAHSVLGELRRMNNDAQGSEESFLRAMDLNPNESLAYHWFGNMLFAQGRFPEAVVWHRHALELNPLSVTISNSLAQDLLAAGLVEEAAEQYNRSIEISPGFVATYAHLAQLQRFAYGRSDEAARLLYQAYSLDPAHSEYAALMAETLLELDAHEAAARWAEQATTNAPDHWWPSRAAILVALSSDDEQMLHDSLETYAPNLGLAWLTLVARRDLLLEAGDLDGARQLFVEALPDLFADPPVVNESNFYIAPALAVVHQARGEDTESRALLGAVLATLETLRADGYEDFDISEVEAHALSGNHELALDILETQMNNDWINLWWYALEGPNLSPLVDKPRLIGLLERIRQNMRSQRDGLDKRYMTPPDLDELDAASNQRQGMSIE